MSNKYTVTWTVDVEVIGDYKEGFGEQRNSAT